MKIRVGSSFLSDGDLIDVDQAVAHELYDSKALINDIGMLHIKNNLEFSENVQSISLAEPYAPLPPDESEVVILGWGVYQVFFLSINIAF